MKGFILEWAAWISASSGILMLNVFSKIANYGNLNRDMLLSCLIVLYLVMGTLQIVRQALTVLVVVLFYLSSNLSNTIPFGLIL